MNTGMPVDLSRANVTLKIATLDRSVLQLNRKPLPTDHQPHIRDADGASHARLTPAQLNTLIIFPQATHPITELLLIANTFHLQIHPYAELGTAPFPLKP